MCITPYHSLVELFMLSPLRHPPRWSLRLDRPHLHPLFPLRRYPPPPPCPPPDPSTPKRQSLGLHLLHSDMNNNNTSKCTSTTMEHPKQHQSTSTISRQIFNIPNTKIFSNYNSIITVEPSLRRYERASRSITTTRAGSHSRRRECSPSLLPILYKVC